MLYLGEFVVDPPLAANVLQSNLSTGTNRLGSDFIPNDTILGGEKEPSMILLTGPNMVCLTFRKCQVLPSNH